ncbi:MAG: hypothetical protein ACOYMV_12400, partial [Verrucomicrobiia bacterium]
IHVRKPTCGSALITTMAFVAILSVLLGALLQWAGTESVQVTRRHLRIDSFYGAEAAMRRSMAQVQQLIVRDYPMDGYIISNPTSPTQSILNSLVSGSPPSSVAALANFTYSGVSIGYATNSGSTNIFTSSQISPQSTDPLAGLYSTRVTLRCSATAIRAGRYNIPKTVQQEFYIDYVPIFQYAVFYNMDMEAFNGPNMVINGKVHVNGTFYFNPFGNLSINGNLTCSQELWYGLKKWNATAGQWQTGTPTWNSGKGDFNVKNPISGTYVNARSGTGGSSTYYDSKIADWNIGSISRWNGGVKNADHGIGAITPPLPSDVLSSSNPNQPYAGMNNPYHVMIESPVVTTSDNVTWSVNTASDTSSKQKAKMAYAASLVIHRSGTNVYFKVPLRDGSGNVTSYKTVKLLNQSQIVPNATATVRDQREYLMDNNKITMTELYLEKLYAAVNAGDQLLGPGGTPINQDAAGNAIATPTFNGVVYFYDDGYNGTASTGRRPGLRVDDKPASGASATKSATQVDSFSLISENPVYVLGHFNSDGNLNTGPEGTGSSGGSPAAPSKEVSLNPADGTNPTGVKPAMIVADAVSFLSASWNRSQDDDNASISTLWGNRTVSAATEVNVAVIAGASTSSKTATLTSGDGTTGGIHNYPRFMEAWASQNFKISGSMVSLFYSQQSKSYFVDSGGSPRYSYEAPTRYFAFDTEFLDPNKLPRGTPVVRRFANGTWTKL